MKEVIVPSFHMNCRICGSDRVELFLDLTDQPHCNRLIPKDKLNKTEPRFPLRAGFCQDCTLVQIDHTIPKESMFSDYPYVSGTTKTLVRHFNDTAARLVKAYHLKPSDLVVDIGSNDGSWLAGYRPFGIRTLGVEAAANVAQIAQKNGLETLNRFFNEETADLIIVEKGKAKLITAAGVFFHLEELHSVVRGIEKLLSDEGIFVVQAIYLGGMIENLAFDQIYHEHLCYYTLRSLEKLFSMHGLEAVSANIQPVHGGSLEVHVVKKGARTPDSTVEGFRKQEGENRYGEFETYRTFAKDVWKLRDELKAVLEDFRAQGKSVYAYGAPAKGSTLLNSFGIGPELCQTAAEKNPMKVGFYIPGVRIPIQDENLIDKPDAYLLLAWNFLEEFLKKEESYLKSGGTFIVPGRKVRILTQKDIHGA